MGLIKQIQEAVDSHEGLSVKVLSEFLKKYEFAEDGFRFVGIENNMVFFDVPLQNDMKWYSGKDLAEEKWNIAREISKKYNLETYHPNNRYFQFDGKFSFKSPEETIAIAHPRYLAVTVKKFHYGINLDELFKEFSKLYA